MQTRDPSVFSASYSSFGQELGVATAVVRLISEKALQTDQQQLASIDLVAVWRNTESTGSDRVSAFVGR